MSKLSLCVCVLYMCQSLYKQIQNNDSTIVTYYFNTFYKKKKKNLQNVKLHYIHELLLWFHNNG